MESPTAMVPTRNAATRASAPRFTGSVVAITNMRTRTMIETNLGAHGSPSDGGRRRCTRAGIPSGYPIEVRSDATRSLAQTAAAEPAGGEGFAFGGAEFVSRSRIGSPVLDVGGELFAARDHRVAYAVHLPPVADRTRPRSASSTNSIGTIPCAMRLRRWMRAKLAATTRGHAEVQRRQRRLLARRALAVVVPADDDARRPTR